MILDDANLCQRGGGLWTRNFLSISKCRGIQKPRSCAISVKDLGGIQSRHPESARRLQVRLALHKFFFRQRVQTFARMEGLAVLPWLAVPCPSIVSRYPNAEELLEE